MVGLACTRTCSDGPEDPAIGPLGRSRRNGYSGQPEDDNVEWGSIRIEGSRSSLSNLAWRASLALVECLSPAAVAPRRPCMALGTNVGHGVEPVRAPGMTATHACQAQPAATPRPVQLDGLEPILRAGRQMPAFPAEQRLQAPAIGMDRSAGDGARGPRCVGHDRGALVRLQAPIGAGCSAGLASACASARSTASKTSSVEAWRAL